jgi:hypothetical protein
VQAWQVLPLKNLPLAQLEHNDGPGPVQLAQLWSQLPQLVLAAGPQAAIRYWFAAQLAQLTHWPLLK